MLTPAQTACLLSLSKEEVRPYLPSMRANTLASLERRGFIFLYQSGIRLSKAGAQVLGLRLAEDFRSWKEDLHRASEFRKHNLRRL